ncbi:MAG: aldo/keto reductase [Spirochaetaceae bacterium]|jgi:aryl-alcohol dehydrogenase-like predicted oxidoreductase|nr:aldo/keto reductase [Spirochaetaceae bacterium]
MLQVVLGRTGLRVNKDGFGALPVQRTGMDEAVRILQKALEGGINFFDTARVYSDSEEKIGAALSSRRDQFILATKTPAKTAEAFRRDLEISLRLLRTDHIDIYQFHNPEFCPRPGDGTGLYEAMLAARDQGKIRFIGISNHRLSTAQEAVESGLYDTLQFPFNYLSDERDEALVRRCAEKNVGFIAMKALSGGLLTDVAVSRSWLARFEQVVPIWGIQREKELDMLLAAMKDDSLPGEARLRRIEADRAELSGAFCRGCGYCMPCPVEIIIHMCARMSLIVRRMPSESFRSEQWQREMNKIPNCLHCGVCASRCPYGLDTPGLLEKNYWDYQAFLAG